MSDKTYKFSIIAICDFLRLGFISQTVKIEWVDINRFNFTSINSLGRVKIGFFQLKNLLVFLSFLSTSVLAHSQSTVNIRGYRWWQPFLPNK